MGNHIDTRQKTRKKRQTNEDMGERKRRASFKSYLRQLDEELLEDELDELEDFDLEDDE